MTVVGQLQIMNVTMNSSEIFEAVMLPIYAESLIVYTSGAGKVFD